jgi:hypothetical protein
VTFPLSSRLEKANARSAGDSPICAVLFNKFRLHLNQIFFLSALRSLSNWPCENHAFHPFDQIGWSVPDGDSTEAKSSIAMSRQAQIECIHKCHHRIRQIALASTENGTESNDSCFQSYLHSHIKEMKFLSN